MKLKGEGTEYILRYLFALQNIATYKADIMDYMRQDGRRRTTLWWSTSYCQCWTLTTRRRCMSAQRTSLTISTRYGLSTTATNSTYSTMTASHGLPVTWRNFSRRQSARISSREKHSISTEYISRNDMATTEKEVTFHIDKSDGLVSLYIKNREVRNHLADGKPRVIGEMTSASLNAVEWLTNAKV